MKQSFNVKSTTMRFFATLFLAVCATSISLWAQVPVPNQGIKIATIPQATIAQMVIIDTRIVDLPAQTLGAAYNSTVGGSFKVPADGQIVLKLSFDHKGPLPINHTVRIELRDPNNVVVAKINEFIVAHNQVKTATLTAIASTALSGCGGLNRWSYKVINNDNVNHQATLVSGTVKTADATGFRSVFPSGGYTLSQNQFGDFVFQTPKGHRGSMKIKVSYMGSATVEARLFKPNVEPAPNEANAVEIKSITASEQSFVRLVSATDVDAPNQFWTIRLRNKSLNRVTNAKVTIEFTDCTE